MMKQIFDFCKKPEFLLLNGILLIYFIVISNQLPYGVSDDLILFAPDSQTYYHTGSEFYRWNETGDSIIRPFLYSTILKLFYDWGGAWLVVSFHVLCWIASANLIFYGIKFVTNHVFTRFVAVGVYMANISLITYTYFGLTELFTVFLLSLACFFILQTVKKGLNQSTWFQILFIFVLLTVVKPLFQYPLLVILIVGLIRFRKTVFSSRKSRLTCVSILLPLLLQMGMMYQKYGIFRVSTIDSHTFDTYFVAQGIREIQGVKDIDVSKQMALSLSKEEKKAFVLSNKHKFVELFFKNITANILAIDSSFIVPKGYHANYWFDYMNNYNLKLFLYSRGILVIFLVLTVVDILRWKWMKNWQPIALGLVLYYIVFGSGISFSQGDRLVVFSIPVWICLYVLLAYSLIETDLTSKLKMLLQRK